MTEQQIENLSLSLRKIIISHSHVVSRVKNNDERTMRIHLMSMLDKIETELSQYLPDILTLKIWQAVIIFVKHAFKRQHRYCQDDYINQICYIMQIYCMQLKLIEKKNSSKEVKKKEKGRLTRETASKLFELTV